MWPADISLAGFFLSFFLFFSLIRQITVTLHLWGSSRLRDDGIGSPHPASLCRHRISRFPRHLIVQRTAGVRWGAVGLGCWVDEFWSLNARKCPIICQASNTRSRMSYPIKETILGIFPSKQPKFDQDFFLNFPSSFRKYGTGIFLPPLLHHHSPLPDPPDLPCSLRSAYLSSVNP